ncbi:hypothetical protein [Varibaculum cambriense]|uniref:hypothetical protein n=1 Tax=Varibaculum cambriense TaxID=184870 RepID=UPI002914462A|nr:hypothetical protein [Varibaculum cambriense]MDU5542811.1 hypothetical protein [Varibaculum cambriense]
MSFSPPPLIHAMSTSSEYALDETWQLMEPKNSFKGLRIEKRGAMYRIPGSCLPNFDMQTKGARIVASLPDDVPKPNAGCVTVGLAIYTNNVRYSNQMLINYLGQIVIISNSGGIANFYFPDIVWYLDECEQKGNE